MLLQFISEPTIGPRERRLIRSHVMKGKNIGKARQSKTKTLHQRDGTSQHMPKEHATEHEDHVKHILSLHRVFWNGLSLTSYPCDTTPELERLVYQRLWTIIKAVYPPEFCTEVILSNYVWYQYLLSDRAYFHTLLAILASFPTHFGGPRHISSEAIKHISQAYRMINERLSGSEACSDQAIAVVTMLAIYQRMHHQQAIGLVHFHGLKRMIELRGGLAKLSTKNRTLAQKPWRLALEFVLQDGDRPAFDMEDVPYLNDLTSSLVAGMGSATFQLPIDPVLQTLLVSISSLTHYLNTTHIKLDPLDYSDAVCLHLHRLLDYAPLNSLPTSPLNDLVHSTLVTIMTTLMPEYGHNQARYDLLATRLQDALQPTLKGYVECEVLLWAVFVGYATILRNNKDEEKLASLGIELCMRLNVYDWTDVLKLLCRYAWTHAFYDKAGLRLLELIKDRARNWAA